MISVIFISYARLTATQAQFVAELLRALGYNVWRDDELPAHRAYTEVIEERLRVAKAVLVLWSSEAVKSQWVRAEAEVAREAGTLLQVTIDGTIPPLPFNQIQCAALADWDGRTDAPGWQKVVAGINELIPGDAPTALVVESPLTLPHLSKPSIAVLPFSNASGDPEQMYFAAGMVEEISTALARFESLFVNTGGSNPVYSGTTHNPREIGAELGVRYLLEGSVRKSSDRLRIAVKLVESATGVQLWAQAFDGTLENVFALQDAVANAVANQIEPNIEANEVRQAMARPTQDLGAYDLFLRAIYLTHYMEHDALLAALELLDEAIARDPNYAPALAMASFCQGEIRAMAWTDYSETARLRGLDLARRALRNGNDDARVLGFVAMATFTLGGDVVASDALIARALARNPGSSHAWGMSGWLNEYGGRHQIVLEHFNAALRLDPRSLYRPTTLHGMAAANFGLRHFEEAALLDREAMMLLPDYESPRLGLCATYAHLGQVADAKAVLGKMPLQTIKSWLNLFRDPVHREQLRSELALAGAHV